MKDLPTSRVRTGAAGFGDFCEHEDTKPRKTSTWFALSEDRRQFAFARLARRTGAEERAV